MQELAHDGFGLALDFLNQNFRRFHRSNYREVLFLAGQSIAALHPTTCRAEAQGNGESEWRREGDSNPRYFLGTHALQACALNHSAISPPANSMAPMRFGGKPIPIARTVCQD